MNREIILILTLTSWIGYAGSWSYDFQNSTTGLTFVKLAKARISYDTYTILYHIDISQYKSLTTIIENFVKDADEECSRLKTSENCKIMIERINILLGHMKRDEIDIEAYQQKAHSMDRQKRAIEFVGDFFHWAFGLMNAATAREYEEMIIDLQRDNSRIHDVIQKQTILIKEMLSINNETTRALSKQIERIKFTVNL